MIKRTLTLVSCLIIAITVMAGHVTPTQAEQAAQAFLNKKDGTQQSKRLRLARQQALTMNSTGDEAAYYVFNVGQDQGFVMVSGDDRTPAILGYAESGQYNQQQLPANVKAWFDGIAEQMAWLDRTEGKYERPRLKLERDAVKPLLKSTWNQGAPYNNMCPIDPTTSERSVTGCVATALAQVINYHRYPRQTTAAIPAYTTSTLSISMPEIPVTTIDWDHMLNSYDGTTTTAQQNAVAQLMLLCGQAVGMDYSSDQSGAESTVLVNALQNYFGYDRTTRVLSRNSYSADEWDDLLYSEMAEGRPVLYSGLSAGGGHEFVIDGYKSDGLFHVNWGWGGSCDGYFLISVLNPGSTSGIGASSTSDGFSFEQDAVVGIQHGTNEIVPELLTVYSLNAGTTSYTRSASSDDFADINITSEFYNMSGVTANEMMMALALLDSEGNWATDGVLDGVNFGTLGNYRGTRSHTFTCSFGADLPDGTYHIVPFAISEYSEVWEPAFGANVYNIKAVISGNKLTLTNPKVSLNGIIQAQGKTEVAHKLQLKASITNRGTYFNNTVYLFVNDELMGGRNFEAEEGETRDFEIDFTPTNAGSNTVSLVYEADGGLVAFATTNINVAEAATGQHLKAEINIVNADVASIVTTDLAQVKVKVINDGDTDYDHQVRVSIWKWSDNDNYYNFTTGMTQDLQLAAGQTTTISHDFTDLDDLSEYLVMLNYVSGGEMQRDEHFAYFTTAFNETEEPGTYIINPNFDNASAAGWQGTSPNMVGGGSHGPANVAEHYNKTFDTYQDLTGLAAGVYGLSASTTFRGSWNDFMEKKNPSAVLYASANGVEQQSPFTNMWSALSTENLSGETDFGTWASNRLVDVDGIYFYAPNDPSYARLMFEAGYYQNTVFFETTGEARIGVKNETLCDDGCDNWAIFDSFQLKYYGSEPDAYKKWVEESAPKFAEGITVTTSYMEAYQNMVSGKSASATDAASAQAAVEEIKTSDEFYAIFDNQFAWAKYRYMTEYAIDVCGNPEFADYSGDLLDYIMEHDGDMDALTLTTEELQAGCEEIQQLIDLTIEAAKNTVNPGDDVTSKYLTNADFSNGGTGWIIGKNTHDISLGGDGISFNWNIAEAYDTDFDIYQDIANPKVGVYKLELKGFFRMLRDDNALSLYKAGMQTTDAGVYVGTTASQNKTFLHCVFEEPITEDHILYDYSGMWTDLQEGNQYPNNMQSAAACFENDMYRNVAYGLVANEGETMRVGVSGNVTGANWICWDDFRLTYMGYDVATIKPLLQQAVDGLDLNKPMAQSVFQRALKAIQTAQSALKGTDGQAMLNALNSIYSADNDVQLSIMEFSSFIYNILEKELYPAIDKAVNTEAAAEAIEWKEFINDGMQNHEFESEELADLVSTVKSLMQYMGIPDNAGDATATHPVDLSGAILNNEFTDNSNMNSTTWWTISGRSNFGNDDYQRSSLALEFWDNPFHIYQDIENLPNGLYELQVSAMARYGSIYDDLNRWQNGEKSDAYLYAVPGINNDNELVSTPVKLLFEGARTESTAEGEISIMANNGITYYAPNDMVSFSNYKESYKNSLTVWVTDGKLRVGVSKPTNIDNGWVIMDSWRLKYLGDGSTTTESQLAPADITAHDGNEVELPVMLDNEDLGETVVGVSFTLQLPEGVTVVTDDDDPVCEFVSNRVNRKQFNITPTQYEDGIWGFRIYTTSTAGVIKGTEGAFMTIRLKVAEGMAEGNYEVKLKENKLSVRGDDNSVTSVVVSDATSVLTVENYIMGDVNADGEVDLSDAIMVTYYSLHVTPTNFIVKAADMNGDGEIDLSDAIIIIYKSLGIYESRGTEAKTATATGDYMVLNTNQTGDFALSLTNEDSYLGMQCDIVLPQGATLDDVKVNDSRCNGFTTLWNRMENGSYRVALFAANGNAFFGQSGDLLSFSIEGTQGGTLKVENIFLVDTNLQKRSFDSLTANTTGIGEIENSKTGKRNGYDLQGRKTAAKKGIRIIDNRKVVAK